MRFSHVRAAIDFRSTVDSTRTLRGREWMSISCYADGTYMYRAQSENHEKDLVRDVLMRLDASWRPLECFFDLRRAGRHAGSMRYRFGRGYAEAEGWNVDDGDVRIRLDLDGTPAGFCPHPVSSDALLMAAFDHRASQAVQNPPHLFMSSKDLFGATGPTLHPVHLQIEYLGRSTLATPVGDLATDRYRLPLDDDGTLCSVVTCLQGTPVFLRAEVSGTAYPTCFELATLEIGD